MLAKAWDKDQSAMNVTKQTFLPNSTLFKVSISTLVHQQVH